jgi:uncharacterized membrane protein
MITQYGLKGWSIIINLSYKEPLQAIRCYYIYTELFSVDVLLHTYLKASHAIPGCDVVAPFASALAVSRQHDELVLQRNAAEQHAKMSLKKVAAILVEEYKVGNTVGYYLVGEYKVGNTVGYYLVEEYKVGNTVGYYLVGEYKVGKTEGGYYLVGE